MGNQVTKNNSVAMTATEFQTEISRIVKKVKNGEMDPLGAYVPFKQLETMFKDALKEIEEEVMDEALKHGKNFEYGGQEFTIRNGAGRIQYSESPVYAEKQAELKSIEELIKTANKTGQSLPTADGQLVESVSVKYSKDSLVMKSKKS